jgi:hypothetical protein
MAKCSPFVALRVDVHALGMYEAGESHLFMMAPIGLPLALPGVLSIGEMSGSVTSSYQLKLVSNSIP